MSTKSKRNKSQEKIYQACIETALKAAKKKGAALAEASLSVDAGLSVTVRKSEIETLEHHQNKGLAVTVYLDQCKGSATTSDLSDKAIRQTVDKAVDIARFTAKDENAGIADAEDLAWEYPDLNLSYPWQVSADELVDMAQECEHAALKSDKRIVNSEGASVSTYESFHVYGNSQGFIGSYPSSSHSLSCSVIGKAGDVMQRDYWYSVARDSNLLEDAKAVGRQAAKRTLARLNAKKLSTMKVPVLFSPEMAAGLIGHFIAAISGASIYRKASFLQDSLNQKVFPEWMQIFEQPHIVSGLGSAPFDSEGVKTRSRSIIDAGVLQSYVLNSYAARKLGMKTTGNAGGVHNLTVAPTISTQKALLKEMGKGILVTELMGQGINGVTGDYSRGAAGFWVENGEIQYPVEEITIAGNLKQIYQQIVAVADDVDLRRNTRTGSILVEEMMIAGD